MFIKVNCWVDKFVFNYFLLFVRVVIVVLINFGLLGYKFVVWCKIFKVNFVCLLVFKFFVSWIWVGINLGYFLINNCKDINVWVLIFLIKFFCVCC